LLPLVVLVAIAQALRKRDEWIAAGVFAFGAVGMWGTFLGILFTWWGWSTSSTSSNAYHGWNWALWLLLVLLIGAAAAALRRFRFPLLLVYVLGSVYFLVVDVISNGGNWSAVVTLFIGLVYLAVGVSVDRGPRNPYGFWWHFSAAFLIGGTLVYWWHSSEADWALLATASVLYILLAGHTQRSIWALLGIVGFFAAATHWTIEWVSTGLLSIGSDRSWVPLVVVAVVGFFFVLLGLLLEGRRRRREPTPLPAS
jgi:MFS family permease